MVNLFQSKQPQHVCELQGRIHGILPLTPNLPHLLATGRRGTVLFPTICGTNVS